ncbi:hypothetical protein FW759_04500 [Psychrobacter sp. 1176_08]|uniref:YadA-like family protein n=1 Tax=Psychrobacter sp. 1176_08 TaxID=2604452 RepID=UPI004063A45D
MNRSYKVIWNQSLNCFMAVAEYAKSRGKSSSNVVSSTSTASAVVSSGARLLRLSSLTVALAAAGLSIQANAADTFFVGDTGTAIVGDQQALNVKGGADTNNLSDNNIGVIAADTTGDINRDSLTIKLSRTITGLTSVQAANTTINNMGVIASGNADGIYLTGNQNNGVTVFNGNNDGQAITLTRAGLNNGGNQINNLADGTINDTSLQAVNGRQLNTTNNNVATNADNIANLTNGTAGIVREDNGTGALTVGSTAAATADNAIAMGVGAKATDLETIAIGRNASAAGGASVAIGDSTVTTDIDSVAIGNDSKALGARTIAIGDDAVAGDENITIVDAIAIGTGSRATGSSSISIGTGNLVSGNNSGAIGDPTTITGTGSYSLGNDNTINADNAFAIGNNITIDAGLDGAVGIGNDTTVAESTVASFTPTGATVVGTAVGNNVVSIGAAGSERRLTNVAAGGADTDAVNVSQLKAVDDRVSGIDFPIRSSNAQPFTTIATGIDALAVGSSASATNNNASAVGETASATGSESTALGAASQAFASSATAVGFGARADQYGATAIGVSSRAQGQYSTAVGINARATEESSTALGRFAEATVIGGVALGQGSVANVAGGATGFVPTVASTLDQAAITATNSTNLGAVSVGTGLAGGNRQIVNVAAGTNDSDAVNVSQLKSVENVANQGINFGNGNTSNNFALGETISVTGDNNLTATTTPNGVQVTLNQQVELDNSGSVEIGTRGGFTGNATTVDRDGLVTGTLFRNTTVDRNGVSVDGLLGANADLAANGLTIANSLTGFNANLTANGLTIANGPSITRAGGINAANRKIVNVDNGTNASDAVNFGQLTDTDNIARGNLAALGGNAAYDATNNAYTPPSYFLDDGNNTGTNAPAYNDVGSALGNLDVRTTTNTSNIAALNTRVDGIDFPIRSSGNQPFTTAAAGPNALAVGSNANANGNSTTAVGENTNATGLRSSAIGTNALADKEDSSALGANARATDIGSTALGSNASASGLRSNAIGFSAVANKEDSSALGANARATGIGSTALGNSSDSRGLRSNALGANAFADKEDSSALGAYARATGIGSNALGSYAKASGLRSNAIGTNARAVAEDSTAIGTNSSATAIGGVALGQGSVANVAGGATGFAPTAVSAVDQAAITATNSTNLGAVSVGTGAAGGNRQIVNVAAGTNDSDAVNVAQLTSVANIANQGFNISADIGATDNVQLGEAVNFTNTDGNLVATVSDNGINYDLAENINLGVNGSVTTGNTVTNNTGVTITDSTNTAIKTTITTAGTNVTDGNGNTGNYGAATTVLTDDSGNTNASAAIGNAILNNDGGNISAAAGNIIFNDEGANISGAAGNLIVNDLGDTNTSTATSNIISDDGDNITTTSATGTNVTDGTNTSTYGADGLVAADDAGNSTIVNQTGLSFTNTNGTTTPSITAAGIDAGMTQITGVKSAGDITNIANANNATNAGDVNAAITGVTNLGLTFAGDSGTDVQRNLGQTLNITGGATGNLTTGNIGVVANGADGLSIQLAEAIDLGATGSVRLGDTNVNSAGITILNGPVNTVILGRNGLNNGGNRITNVADGAVADDAATFGQVTAVEAKVDTLGSNTATNLGGGAIYDDMTGSISAPTYTLDTGANTGTTADFSDVGSALSNLDGRTTTNTGAIADIQTQANQGFNVSAAGGTADNVQLGQTVDFTNTDGNLVVTNDVDNGINYNLAENIDLGINGSVTTGNTVTNNAGVKVDDGAGNATTITTGGTNVVDAAGNSADYTAIGSILDDGNGNTNVSSATGNTIDDGNGNVTSITSVGTNVTDGTNTSNYGANGFTATDAAGNNGISINQGGVSFINGAGAPTGPSVTAAGFNAGGTVITNVGDGVAATDAANKGQVDAVSDGLADLTAGAVQYDKNQDNTVNKGSITLGGTGGTTITNVKAGNVSAGSTDAINGSQLHNLGNGVASIIGGDAALDASGNLTASNIGGTGKGNISDAIAAVNQGNAQANENIQANTDRLDAGLSFGADSGATISKPIGDTTALKFEGGNNITTTATSSGIKFDLNGNIDVDNITADTVTTGNTTVNNTGVTIKDGPSMTTAGINAGDKTITGVADGIEVNDAVNLGQLTALDNKLSNSVNELGYKINEVEDDANAGISAAMAMSSLPQAYIPGKSMVGGGIATYNGQSAVAIGVSKVSDNGRWVIKVNGTADTQGNAGGAVGAGFHF